MNYTKLKRLEKKPYFTVEDVAAAFGIKPESARVLCSRYAKDGVFVRLKNNFYIPQQKWEGFSGREFMIISNFLQVPSYISFMTALSFYGVTTQIQRGFYENASLKRSARFEAAGASFSYYKLQKQHYFDFVKKDGVFIATKEKAFIDALQLYCFGKYSIDFSSLDLKKLDKNKLKVILRAFPEKTKKTVKKLCGI